MKIILKISLIVALTCLIKASYTQSLDSLLELTVNNNVLLKSINEQYKSELLKQDQVSQLSNPELGVAVPILRPQTRLGGQVLMVSASQMFPWFGTFKTKKNVVIAMSKVKFNQITIEKLFLFNKVKNAYYNLQFLEEKSKIINEFIANFEITNKIALAKVESGQSTAADVLRIQIKLQELKQELKLIDNKKKIFSSQINEITNENPSKIVKVISSNNVFPNYDFDLKNFDEKIKNNHPLFEQLDNKIEVSKNIQLANEKANLPKIGLGLDYSMVSARTDANPMNNGQDILIPKIKVSIPLYRKAYRAKNKQEMRIQKSIEFQKINLENKMKKQLIGYESIYKDAFLKFELFDKQIITLKRVNDILTSKYSTKGKGFDELLQIENKLLAYKLNKRKQILVAKTAISNTERITKF